MCLKKQLQFEYQKLWIWHLTVDRFAANTPSSFRSSMFSNSTFLFFSFILFQFIRNGLVAKTCRVYFSLAFSEKRSKFVVCILLHLLLAEKRRFLLRPTTLLRSWHHLRGAALGLATRLCDESGISLVYCSFRIHNEKEVSVLGASDVG